RTTAARFGDSLVGLDRSLATIGMALPARSPCRWGRRRAGAMCVISTGACLPPRTGERRGAHIGRRRPIGSTERMIERGNIAEAGFQRDSCDAPSGAARIHQLAMGASKPAAEREAGKCRALRFEEHLDVAR